jgi:leucyl-tRNA synthetase
MKFRSASQHALFNSLNDLKWYLDRVGNFKNCSRKVLTESLHTIIELIAPLVPHMAEEFWSKVGGKDFVSVEDWPKFDQSKTDRNAVDLEQIFKKTIEDLRNILKMTGAKKNVYLYTASDKEFKHIDEGKEFIKKQFGFKKVSVFKSSDKKIYDPQNKAGKAKYGKPGIFLE